MYFHHIYIYLITDFIIFSRAMARMDVLVPPILYPSSYLGPCHWDIISVQICIIVYLKYTISLLLSLWTIGRPWTMNLSDPFPDHHPLSGNSSTLHTAWSDCVIILYYLYSKISYLPRASRCLKCIVPWGEITFSSSPTLPPLAIDSSLKWHDRSSLSTLSIIYT